MLTNREKKIDNAPPAELEPANEHWQSAVTCVEVEQAILGALLLDPQPIHDVLEILTAEDFYRADHREIFSAIAHLVDSNSNVDVITVAERLSALNAKFEFSYLVDLAGNVSGSANVTTYAKIIFEKSIKRQALAAVSEVNTFVLRNTSATADEVVNFAQTALVNLNDRSDRSTRAVTASEALRAYVLSLDARMHSSDELQGFSSGFPNVDRITNGWKRGHLVVIAGRPGMGKTTYALQLSAHMSVCEKLNGLFFSLEMPQDEIMEKMIACVGSIQLENLQNPRNVRNEDFWPSVESAARRIKDASMHIVECPGIHINQLRSYARKAHRRKKLDWIMIDHVHILESDGQSRERQVSKISSDLKNLAGELQIPVFALAQLNRKVEDRKFEDRAPRLSDLRDSGGLEQDADIVQLIYRPDYYNDNPHEHNRGLIQVETAKHRNGKKGTHTFINKFEMSKMDVAAHGVFIDQSTPRKSSSIRRFDDL